MAAPVDQVYRCTADTAPFADDQLACGADEPLTLVPYVPALLILPSVCSRQLIALPWRQHLFANNGGVAVAEQRWCLCGLCITACATLCFAAWGVRSSATVCCCRCVLTLPHRRACLIARYPCCCRYGSTNIRMSALPWIAK